MTTMNVPDLHVISWNVTRRCNLECSHCYLPAVTRKSCEGSALPGDLSTREALHLIDEIAAVNPEVMLILSGGEPLLREDIFDLAGHATGKGMMVVLGSNGLLIDEAVVDRLKRSGVSGVSISLDSVEPSVHDAARSCPGAWARTVEAIKTCSSRGLSTQINTVVTQKNYNSLPSLITFAQELGAKVYSPFFLVCTGRGEELSDITPHQYEDILSYIVQIQGERSSMMVRTRCAPTYRRILYDRKPDSPLLRMDTGRCLAGVRYCRISPEGDVTPCPYMRVSVGNVRQQSFGDLWNTSPVFEALRKPALKGKCGQCRFRSLCGGCRARAYAVQNDYLQEDRWCNYVPDGGAVVKISSFEEQTEKFVDEALQPRWTAEAEERLRKVPFFVRNMVRAAVEGYARDNKCREITPDVMEAVKSRAMGGAFRGH